MKFQFNQCKKCKKLGIKIHKTEGYYTFKKGFVGKTVRVYVSPKEQIINNVCIHCGFDNKKNIPMRKIDFKIPIITERFE